MHLLWFLRIATCLFVLFASAPADAHEVGLSRGEYSAQGAHVSATLTFARRDVDPADAAKVVDELWVRGDGVRCPGRVVTAAPFETDGVRIVAEAACETTPKRLEVEAMFLVHLPFGHRHLAHLSAPDAPSDAALTVGRRTISFEPSAPAASARPSLLWLGAEHILGGVDHLVFLLGLVLVLSRMRDALLAVTAFTIGHSLSLALSTFGVFVPSPRWVEPLIALSIVWVGVENLFSASPWARVRVALPFGLVHGFGFAAALHELGLPKAELPLALASFNVGVELGQVGVMVPLWSALQLVAKRPWFGARVVRPLSIAIAIAGVAWFVLRIRHG